MLRAARFAATRVPPPVTGGAVVAVSALDAVVAAVGPVLALRVVAVTPGWVVCAVVGAFRLPGDTDPLPTPGGLEAGQRLMTHAMRAQP